MKVFLTKRKAAQALSVAALAALLTTTLPVKQAEAASFYFQNQAPIVIQINGSSLNLGSFLEQLFNLDKWTNSNNGNANNKPGPTKPGPTKPGPTKPEPSKPDPVKPDKDKPDKDKPEKDSRKEYEAITKEATQQLTSLRNESKQELMRLAIEAKTTKNPKEKSRIFQQGQSTFNQKTSQYKSITSAVRSKLQAKGFSTEIIDQYDSEFNEEVALGKSLLNTLVK